MIGSGCKAAISGPSRYFLTMDFEPSAPTSRVPDTSEPSSKVALTLVSSFSMVLSLLPYY